MLSVQSDGCARDDKGKQHVQHTWTSSNDFFFNQNLALGHDARLSLDYDFEENT